MPELRNLTLVMGTLFALCSATTYSPSLMPIAAQTTPTPTSGTAGAPTTSQTGAPSLEPTVEPSQPIPATLVPTTSQTGAPSLAPTVEPSQPIPATPAPSAQTVTTPVPTPEVAANTPAPSPPPEPIINGPSPAPSLSTQPTLAPTVPWSNVAKHYPKAAGAAVVALIVVFFVILVCGGAYAYLDIKRMNQDLNDMPEPVHTKEDSGLELSSTRNPIGVSWPAGREENLPMTFPSSEGEGDEY